MNREIKFRFWLGHENKMTYSHTLFEIGQLFQDRIISDVVPMQFTGLKDKHRKKIYEGDIIECWVVGTIETNPHVENLKVVFKVGSFCAENKIRSKDLSSVCKSQPLNKYFECQVIGNIYENPDLLNSDKDVERSVATEE